MLMKLQLIFFNFHPFVSKKGFTLGLITHMHRGIELAMKYFKNISGSIAYVYHLGCSKKLVGQRLMVEAGCAGVSQNQ